MHVAHVTEGRPTPFSAAGVGSDWSKLGNPISLNWIRNSSLSQSALGIFQWMGSQSSGWVWDLNWTNYTERKEFYSMIGVQGLSIAHWIYDICWILLIGTIKHVASITMRSQKPSSNHKRNSTLTWRWTPDKLVLDDQIQLLDWLRPPYLGLFAVWDDTFSTVAITFCSLQPKTSGWCM